MCIVYNTIGSLTAIKSELHRNGIFDFTSVKDVVSFKEEYTKNRQEIQSLHKSIIEQEKITLETELRVLEREIAYEKLKVETMLRDEMEDIKTNLINLSTSAPRNIFHKLIIQGRILYHRLILKVKQLQFQSKVSVVGRNLNKIYKRKLDRYNFIDIKFDDAVYLSAKHALSDIDKKKDVVEGLNTLIYGAIGEKKVVDTLKQLSDDFYLINDFSVSFSPPIYFPKIESSIASIQIDHLLISPSGIFIIETKNWSQKSLNDVKMRSPVDQIKRFSYAVYWLVNNLIENKSIRLDSHHWGNKSIPIRNLIVMTGAKPTNDFEYVKILTAEELVGYVNYFKPKFSNHEVDSIYKCFKGML